MCALLFIVLQGLVLPHTAAGVWCNQAPDAADQGSKEQSCSSRNRQSQLRPTTPTQWQFGGAQQQLAFPCATAGVTEHLDMPSEQLRAAGFMQQVYCTVTAREQQGKCSSQTWQRLNLISVCAIFHCSSLLTGACELLPSDMLIEEKCAFSSSAACAAHHL